MLELAVIYELNLFARFIVDAARQFIIGGPAVLTIFTKDVSPTIRKACFLLYYLSGELVFGFA